MASTVTVTRRTPAKDAEIKGPVVSKPTPPTNLSRRRLLHYNELPEWQRDEDHSYIQSGYRHVTPSIYSCLESWFYLHNESINIHSHVLGAGIFLALPIWLYSEMSPRYAASTAGDITVFGLYLSGVAICFMLSAAFHTLCSHSAQGFRFGIQLDFLGIILLMWSANLPLVFYTFPNEHTLQMVYWSLASVFAVLASMVTFMPAFHKPATKLLRASTFGGLALSTLLTVVHGLVKHGWASQSQRFPMLAIGLTIVLNTTGAIVYISHFPERWWPLKFDITGASHQVMHCLIVLAALAWLGGMLKAFDYEHSLMS